MEYMPIQTERMSDMPLLSQSENRVELLLDYARCFERRGNRETWGATPTDMQASLMDQMKLIHTFARRLTVPNFLSDLDPSVTSYMEDTFLDRFINRCIANDENYRRALSPVAFSEHDETLLPQQAVVEQRVASGTASPAEILALQSIHGIGAIELGSLTHPYGANIEYMADMRDAVEQSIKLFGGEVYETPEDIFSVSDVINGTPLDKVDPVEYMPLSRAGKIKEREQFEGVSGILMTRKRTLGQLPDGTLIRQRTSFVLTKESGLLNDEILDQLAATPDCGHWGREAVKNMEGLDVAIKSLLDTDIFSMVLPVSTTIYAFNKVRVDKINAAIEAEDAKINTAGVNGHDIHHKLRFLAASQLREIGVSGMERPEPKYIDIGNMAFYGDYEDTRSLPIDIPSRTSE